MTEPPARCPTHPGELLRAVLTDGLQPSVAEAARQPGVNRMTLHRLLRGEQVVTRDGAPARQALPRGKRFLVSLDTFG